MKRKSDQIILDEVRESQNNLIKQIVDYQKQNSCSLDEGN